VAGRLKIATVHARNVHRVHGHKRLDDDASLASLLPLESDGVVFWMRRGAVLLKHEKTHLGTTCAYLAVASEQEGCRDSMHLHFDTKSEQSDCNKSSVSKKFRTSAFNKVV